MKHQWTLEQLRYVPQRELLKYVRDGLVEGVRPCVADTEAPWLQIPENYFEDLWERER